MKKLIAMLLALIMVLCLVACGPTEEPAPKDEPAAEPEAETKPEAEPEAEPEVETEPEVEAEPEVAVMTHEEYIAAALDSEVVIETYVQATQGWWFDGDAGYGKITVYAQSEDGAYFIYELQCDEADAPKMVPGAKIRVTGYKGEWAGEVEIMDATFEFVEGDAYIVTPEDHNDLLGSDEMIDHQNELVSFTGLTVESISYKNGEPGDDIYLTFTKDGASYNFCVEVYLTGPDSEVYTTVAELVAGDVVDVECFLYWYEGMNPHITSIVKN